jgi:hypothetical protein
MSMPEIGCRVYGPTTPADVGATAIPTVLAVDSERLLRSWDLEVDIYLGAENNDGQKQVN